MWLFFDRGFVSVVRKTGEAELCVRARVGADLNAFRRRFCPELSPTRRNGGSDYPFRAWVSHEAMARAVAKIAMTLDYPNFKDVVAQKQGKERAGVYCRVWHTLLDLEAENRPTLEKTSGNRPRGPVSRKRKSVGGDTSDGGGGG